MPNSGPAYLSICVTGAATWSMTGCPSFLQESVLTKGVINLLSILEPPLIAPSITILPEKNDVARAAPSPVRASTVDPPEEVFGIVLAHSKNVVSLSNSFLAVTSVMAATASTVFVIPSFISFSNLVPSLTSASKSA